jgi:L-arabinose isomerase
LPVARVFWKPRAGLKTETACWMKAGGTHHTALCVGASLEEIMMISDILDIELLTIDAGTDLVRFRQDLRVIDAFYGLKQLGKCMVA